MGRPRRYETDAERQAAYRARAAADDGLSEQQLRDRHGYSASEERSRAQRQEVAERILAKQDAGEVERYDAILVAQSEAIARNDGLRRAYVPPDYK